jgi:hypothetical protein
MKTVFAALAILASTLPVLAADEPSIKVGVVLVADYTLQTSPEVKDADGNEVNLSSFNVTRAYLNVTGNLNKRISFRITPDVSRETGSGSSLAGSQNFRLKYAFAQLSLDEWTTKGSWARFGVQQTPLVDYTEGIYRYRFQGPIYVEREGYLSSSDAGVSLRYVLPSDHGDIHGGFYNGEGYSKAEVNDQKAFQLRGSYRPAPKSALWKGLRATAFYDSDEYLQDSKRQRLLGQVTFEHKRFNAGIETISTKDRTSVTKPELEGRGWSAWATPKLVPNWELLLRHDDTRPDSNTTLHRRRNIVGVAYWVPNLQKVTAAVMADYDSLAVTGKPDETKFALKMTIVF